MWIVAVLALLLPQASGAPPVSEYKIGANLVDALFIQTEKWVLEGRAPATQFQGELPAAISQNVAVTIEGGARYLIGGYCDEGCSDFRLTVTGPSTGITNEESGSADMPLVGIASSVTGEHTVSVSMVACAKPVCHYGVRLYRL